MAYLKPQIVAQAARALFGRGHSEAIVFFYLKAAGANCDGWITVTSSNQPPGALLAIAGQPTGFDELVEKHIDEFATANDRGLPTRPGARGSTSNYSMFFPIAEECQYLLRKHDCNRNAVWSNIIGGRNALNAHRVRRESLFETRKPEHGGAGIELRFLSEYVFSAFWYYGPARDVPMRVPMRPLAVWMHRMTDLGRTRKVEELVDRTVEILNITEEERYLLFDGEYEFTVDSSDFCDQLDVESYFRALCLPSVTHMPPPIQIAERLTALNLDDWKFRAVALGLRKDAKHMDPATLAQELVKSGKRNLLLYGPPRTGKSYTAMSVAASYLGVAPSQLPQDKRFSRVQFHQGWSYGDFLRRIVPVVEGGAIAFKRENGCFLRHCLTNPSGRSVFVVDEINRANIADVLGEAFQVLEEGYRGDTIELAGKIDGDETASLVIPEDLLFLATANDVDRTTFPFDFALLGRFVTVPFPVQYGEILQILTRVHGWDSEKAESFVILLREIEKLSGYPTGHAAFYNFGPPKDVWRWYSTVLRPLLSLYLTQYRAEELAQIDELFDKWGD